MVVYIIGAGPGDPELLTIKAKRLIKRAEVLIYDKLINKSIINWAPSNCLLIYVGKRENESKKSQKIQKEINDMLLKYGDNKRVVRLKGGDPFIFGRGGEEALICANADIRFEIVPGISSFYAAPAYAGIPISHREYNSVFAVLTGHESEKAKSAIDWSRLPETLFVLMGVSKIRELATNLLNIGRDPTTPVAAVKWGTTIKQKTIMTDLAGLAKGIEDLDPPVVFVIGKIASLHSKLNWFESKLSIAKGKKVVLTRARNRIKESEELMKTYGLKPINMPLIDVTSRDFNLPDLDNFNSLIFTSVEGIKRFIDKVDISGFNGSIFCIGPKTKEFLLKQTGINSTIGNKYNSQGLAKVILDNLKKGSRILSIRSSAASKILMELLSTKFDVTEIYVYDIIQLEFDPELIKGTDAIFVMSASCAKILEKLDHNYFKNLTVVAIGPETSRFLTIPHITATEYTLNGMINEYLNYLWSDLK
ncbi:MAG: uroporphyrinogen-III C-methyltransferase [Promethearchaeota archaeon]